MTVTIVPGDCIAVCPCCTARVHVPREAGDPPTLAHGTDRLSGLPCPREGDPVQDAVLWDRYMPEAQCATVYDFPNVYTVRAR